MCKALDWPGDTGVVKGRRKKRMTEVGSDVHLLAFFVLMICFLGFLTRFWVRFSSRGAQKHGTNNPKEARRV
jgi:hypothetical protein